MKSRILYTKPSITELEVQYATDAAANGWGDKCYDYINRFEAGFKAHLGVDYAIATSSCTGALHLGMAALGIGLGDEVILADTNWIATASPIVHLGATPVFVDILPDTWCLDPAQVSKAITSRTKAIVATHLYGNLCDMARLLALGAAHGIPVIEDAAEAIGSVYQGKRAGSMGVFGAFSFHGTKTLTTGEGGLFVTNDESLFERVLTLSNHGRARGQTKQFWPDVVGFKYKMSNLQAAIGVAQLERIDDLIRRKREIFSYYREHLASLPGIAMNAELPGTENGAWMPTVVFSQESGIQREEIQKAFQAEAIDARVFFWPLSSLPSFGGQAVEGTRSSAIALRAINLPSYHDMTTAELDRVIEVVTRLVSQREAGATDLPETLAITDKTGASLGSLTRITAANLCDEELIASLTKWRNNNRHCFLTQFVATVQRTASWLQSAVIPDTTRAMYIIKDVSGVSVGHLGVLHLDSETPELDNMIRGVSSGNPQIMYWAEVALIKALFSRNGVRALSGHVLSNNWVPLSLHRSVGFEKVGKLSVSKRVVNDEIHYLLDSSDGEPQAFGCIKINLSRLNFDKFLRENGLTSH